jgi:hypothetical protein
MQEEQSFLHLGELCADEVVELDLQRRLLSWIKKKYDCCSARLNLELTPQIDNSVFQKHQAHDIGGEFTATDSFCKKVQISSLSLED